MEFYEVLNKRRTIRDFTNQEVSDELLKKILATAFKAPTNDHLRQMEFIVIRGQENILRVISPVVKNTKDIQKVGLDAQAGTMDKDEYAMFADALPKQQKMLMETNCLVLPFFKQEHRPLCEPGEQTYLNYFASAWASLENILLAATNEGLACAFRIPIGNEPEYVKRVVGAPEGYEFTCFLAIGYPAIKANAFKQKEINVENRIHHNIW
jgi:nitroreductase